MFTMFKAWINVIVVYGLQNKNHGNQSIQLRTKKNKINDQLITHDIKSIQKWNFWASVEILTNAI